MPVIIDIVKKSKPEQGNLTFYATLDQNGDVLIDDVAWFKDTKIANDETAEGDRKRTEIYQGPRFGELDEGLQDSFAEYLDERGLGKIADFVQQYSMWREQRSYVKWLENVKSFVGK